MKRTFLLPEETEREMQEARENRTIDGEVIPFSGGTEKSYVRDIVKQAQTNGRIGDKMLMVVNPLYIHIPEWQRELRIRNAMEIGNNYDPAQWGAPKVMLFDNKLYCIDGQHRIYGTYKANIEFVVVEYLDVTESKAIDLFLGQTIDRTSMSPADYLKAAIAGGKPEYLLFREICKKNNVRIKGDNINFVKNPIGIFTPISDGINLTKNNPELLDRILKLLGKLRWNGSDLKNGKAYSAKVIRTLKKIYAYYEGHETEMERCLLMNCKGSEYFNDNLYEKWQDALFDHISNVLENNMVDVSKVAVMPVKTTARRKKVN